MNYRALIRRKSWMLQPEWSATLRNRRAMLQYLEFRGVALTPYLVSRIAHYLLATALLERAESALLSPRPAEDGETTPSLPVPTPEAFDFILTLQDRVHRALLEIEISAANDGKPAPDWLEELRLFDIEEEPQGDLSSPQALAEPSNPTDQFVPSYPPLDQFTTEAVPYGCSEGSPIPSPTQSAPHLNRKARRRLAKLQRLAA